MILRELNLTSFGQFNNYKVKLDKGINLIYGKNESGKSTIHTFIEGMFYGFLRPYTKNRVFTENLNKYRPWHSESYNGMIKFIHKGKNIRLVRDFNNHKFIIYNDLTGEDISHEIDNGDKHKISNPGLYYLNMNSLVYNNTMSIQQLDCTIDENLAKEVKDRLANLSTTLDDKVSVKKALEYLNAILKDIGTEKAYTSPYGSGKIKLNTLYKERDSLRKSKDEYYDLINRINIIKNNIDENSKKLNSLNDKLRKTRLVEKHKIYNEAKTIFDEINYLEDKIKELENHKDICQDDYSKLISFESDYNHILKDVSDIQESIKLVDENLAILDSEISDITYNGYPIDSILEDYDLYYNLEEEKNSLLVEIQGYNLELQNSEVINLEEKLNKYKRLNKVYLIMGILSLGLVYFHPVLAGLAAFFIFFALINQKKIKATNKVLEGSSEEYFSRKREEEALVNKINEMKNIQKDILEKYNCYSKNELNVLYNDLRISYIHMENKAKERESFNKEKLILRKTLEMKVELRDKLNSQINEIMLKNRIGSMEEFKNALENKRLYEECIVEKKNKSLILEKTLKSYNIKELEEEILENPIDFDEEVFMDENQLINEIESISLILKNYNTDYARLEERIEFQGVKINELLEVQEEIDRVNSILSEYEDKIRSTNIAIELLNSISKEIHDDFAPAINQGLSNLVRSITDGKYNHLKVDEELNISIEEPVTKKLTSIDSLSGGTIDQIYFALRFNIINSLKESTIPLILDDCFVQYDSTRLKNIIIYLNKISEEKQIIIFSCQNREKRILDDIGVDYNLVNLN